MLLFDADTSKGLCASSLLHESIVLVVTLKKQILRVNLSEYKIPFPKDGVYLGLEWLGEIDSDVNHNNAPYYYGCRTDQAKTLISFFGGAFYDLFDKNINSSFIKYAPSFGLELIKH